MMWPHSAACVCGGWGVCVYVCMCASRSNGVRPRPTSGPSLKLLVGFTAARDEGELPGNEYVIDHAEWQLDVFVWSAQRQQSKLLSSASLYFWGFGKCSFC